jgi:hypothetical protein
MEGTNIHPKLIACFALSEVWLCCETSLPHIKARISTQDFRAHISIPSLNETPAKTV